MPSFRSGTVRRSPEPASASGGTGARSILAAIPLSSGAVVMGTGIVSIGLQLDRYDVLSRILLVLAAAAWVVVAVAIAHRWRHHPLRLHQELRSPAALTAVAGSAVLGTRLEMLGWTWAGSALLVIALAAWLALLGPVLANWTRPTVGTSLMLVVSTQSLAVLSAVIAGPSHSVWLVIAALVLFVIGLALYVFVITSFEYRQLTGGRGDHWITGGALAISTLAIAQVALTHEFAGLNETAKLVAVVLWALTIAWLPPLLLGEALWPRKGYHHLRWSTLFPVGMYAACSFLVGAVAHAPAIREFARVWIWVAVALWLVMAVAMVRQWRSLWLEHAH